MDVITDQATTVVTMAVTTAVTMGAAQRRLWHRLSVQGTTMDSERVRPPARRTTAAVAVAATAAVAVLQIAVAATPATIAVQTGAMYSWIAVSALDSRFLRFS